MIRRQLRRMRDVYEEFPRQFWILILGIFIDRLGGALVYPFLTLYVTQKFGVGMADVGVLFGIFSLANVGSNLLGGALADRLGRKVMLIFGLVISGLSSLALGFVGTYELFFLVVMMIGLLANIGGPAGQAMVADLLSEEKRSQGFGILRVAANLAVTIGPMIGGLLATQSYLFLFASDAVSSIITAGIVLLSIRETLPARVEGEPQQTVGQTFAGYRVALRDGVFMMFIGACMLMALVYMQMNTTLPVYLRDTHSVPARGFGYILSLNAGMVVLFQFPITRWVAKVRPLILMALGTLLYAVGFGMYGVVSSYALFLVAMAIVTIGEMLVSPSSQALAANFAPKDMRGRYMAIFGFSWVLPSTLGPPLAGLIMDHADQRLLWYAVGFLGLLATGAFLLLNRRIEQSTEEPTPSTESMPLADAECCGVSE